MTSPTANEAGRRDIVVREPQPEEFARVVYLFRNTRLRAGSRFMAAERLRPVARFLGAAAWWVEGDLGLFQLASPRGSAQMDAAAVLVERVLAAVREAGLEKVQYANLLADGHLWLAVLRAQGFECVRSERSFEVAYADAWTRVMRLEKRHRARIPSAWRTDAIRDHQPEEILDLIAPHRLLPPEDVRFYWRETTAAGFDLDISSILFERERPFGAFLARRQSEVLYIDVQVVEESNPLLRSLAEVVQLYHAAQRMAPGGLINAIQFRSGQVEHRQTANLALRMGGRELAAQHVLARRLEV